MCGLLLYLHNTCKVSHLWADERKVEEGHLQMDTLGSLRGGVQVGQECSLHHPACLYLWVFVEWPCWDGWPCGCGACCPWLLRLGEVLMYYLVFVC